MGFHFDQSRFLSWDEPSFASCALQWDTHTHTHTLYKSKPTHLYHVRMCRLPTSTLQPLLTVPRDQDRNYLRYSDIDPRVLAKWFKHSSKHSNETVVKERLAWQVIASWWEMGNPRFLNIFRFHSFWVSSMWSNPPNWNCISIAGNPPLSRVLLLRVSTTHGKPIVPILLSWDFILTNRGFWAEMSHHLRPMHEWLPSIMSLVVSLTYCF